MAADIASALKNWSTTESSNQPQGSTAISTNLDDDLRMLQTVVRQDLAHKGSDIASATTTDLGAVAGSFHDITGSTTVTGLGTVSAGIHKWVKFEGAVPLVHNATSLILLGGANRTAASGDTGLYISEGSGNWRELAYFKVSGVPLIGDIPDSLLRVVGSSDATKKVAFEVDGLTTGTTRTVTVPDANFTMVGVDTTQTLTAKTLTSPVIDTAVTGTAVATQAQQETGTATNVLVTPGRQHYHPSAAKGWVSFDNNGTILSSYNVSSVTDGGTGDFVVNWGTDFSSANYAVVVTARRSDDSFICAYIGATLSGAQTKIKSADAAGVLKDADNYFVVAFGDH